MRRFCTVLMMPSDYLIPKIIWPHFMFYLRPLNTNKEKKYSEH
jgi:hypothetical protein